LAASGSASAAATSASQADASNTLAGQAATAASQAKTLAETAQGRAETFASNASQSATNALGSFNNATTQAGISATAAAAASASSKATVPSNFIDPKNWVAWNLRGGSVTFENNLANIKYGGSFYSNFVMPLAENQTYRITARHRVINQGGGATYIGTTADGGSNYSWRVSNKPCAPVNQWETTSFEVTTADILAQKATAVGFGVGFLTGYDGVSDAEVSALLIENITVEKNSKSAALASIPTSFDPRWWMNDVVYAEDPRTKPDTTY